MGKIRIPTRVDGLVQVLTDSGGRPFSGPPQVALDTGAQLGVFGQTVNTSPGAANQAIGTVSIPITTADGATVTITNSLITANSFLFLQVKGSSGKKLTLDTVVPAGGSATFTVRTVDALATTAACDVWYWIIN